MAEQNFPMTPPRRRSAPRALLRAASAAAAAGAASALTAAPRAAAAAAAAAAAPDPVGVGRCGLSLSPPSDGLAVTVGSVPWLYLGYACVRSSSPGVPPLLSCGPGPPPPGPGDARGRDPLGDYVESSVLLPVSGGDGDGAFASSAGDARWEVAIRRYEGDSSGTLAFEQRFPTDVRGTSLPGASSDADAAERGLASRYPSFSPHRPGGPVLGALRYVGPFAGAEYRVERWGDDGGGGGGGNRTALTFADALSSGPVVLFTDECALVLSSASAFMSSGVLYDVGSDELQFGVLGSVDVIPRGHSTSVILTSGPLGDGVGPDGIRRAVMGWGDRLLRLHATQRRSDATARNLQFSTDNGAFYYYNTERGMNYQDTIKHVKEVSQGKGLPFRSWLMDSWWYPKGPDGGVIEWEAMPSVFPDGIRAVRDATGWDIVAHNRYFSNRTVYASQNGGNYSFIVETSMALPARRRFWVDLFRRAKTWGLTTYEQDWLYTTHRHFSHLLRSTTAGRDWLIQMGYAADESGIAVQYCMSWPRHVLQSLEVEAATQVRASDDYQPGSDSNWRSVGVTSMFVSALGLVPTKDSFWSSPKAQSRSSYSPNREHASRAHALASTLSGGPVAPSDRAEDMDSDLIMRSCNSEGGLLRPDGPAAVVDTALLAGAGFDVPPGRPRGDVWTASSSPLDGGDVVYTHVMAAGAPGFTITADDMHGAGGGTDVLTRPGEYVAWRADGTRPFRPLSLPLDVPPTSSSDLRYVCVAPVLSNGWAFLGEAETKWIPVSRDRFSRLRVTPGGFSVEVRGPLSEEVKLLVMEPGGAVRRATCVIGPSRVVLFSSDRMGCQGGMGQKNGNPFQ